jgi:hypothetical protein
MIAFFDAEPAAAVLVGEGHAPVVAVLLASAISQSSASSPPKGMDPAPYGFWLNHRVRGNQEGAEGAQ